MPDFDPSNFESRALCETETGFDTEAIFRDDGPIDPVFMNDAIQSLMRATPLDCPDAERQRHLQSALIALAAMNPRDPIEVMLSVQAISAHQAAAACWRIGMNSRKPSGDSTRHISAASTAARTFEAMLRAMERRQAKPLAVPAGRMARRTFARNNAADILQAIEDRITNDNEMSPRERQLLEGPDEEEVIWTPEAIARAEEFMERERIEEENAGLDIANTEGILPGGGMIMPEDPTPQQAAYIGRRLGLMYRREYEENLRQGRKVIPKIRPLRTGDLIP